MQPSSAFLPYESRKLTHGENLFGLAVGWTNLSIYQHIVVNSKLGWEMECEKPLRENTAPVLMSG